MNANLSHPTPAPAARGVTLIELLVTIAILAVLSSLAVPAFNEAFLSSKLASISNSFLSSVVLARSEAIKRNSRVTICKSADGASCTSSGRWDQGWIVFHDSNNNAAVNTGEQVLQYQQALPDGLVMWGGTNLANSVSMTATGGTTQIGSVCMCGASTSSGTGRRVVLSSTGRPRTDTPTFASCQTASPPTCTAS